MAGAGPFSEAMRLCDTTDWGQGQPGAEHQAEVAAVARGPVEKNTAPASGRRCEDKLWERGGLADEAQHEVEAGVPGLRHEVELADVLVPDDVVDVVGQLDAQVFLGADGGDDLVIVGVEDVDGRGAALLRVVQAADDGIPVAVVVSVVDAARARVLGHGVRLGVMAVQVGELDAVVGAVGHGEGPPVIEPCLKIVFAKKKAAPEIQVSGAGSKRANPVCSRSK